MKPVRQAIALVMAAGMWWAGAAMAQEPQPAQAESTQPPESTATAPGVPVAGRAPLGIAIIEMDAVIAGLSVRQDLLRKAVVNEKNEKIGTVDDIIITPAPGAKRATASFAIVGVGGFLGIKRHDVVIPMEQLKLEDNRLVLAGATKEALKALTPFVYRRR